MKCIYKIACLGNGKVYIGKSVEVKNRKRHHFNALRRKEHSNTYLQNAWNKYGENSFKFSIIEECDKELLCEREKYWIKKEDTFRNGFNLTEGGEDGSDVLAEWVKKNGAWNKGKTGYKMPPCTEERKRKISESQMGKVITEEVKRKISKTVSKQWEDPNSVFNTKEYRKKLSDSLRKRWAKRQITKERFLEVFNMKCSVSEKCAKLGMSLPTYYKYRKLYVFGN